MLHFLNCRWLGTFLRTLNLTAIWRYSLQDDLETWMSEKKFQLIPINKI
jgi:hypothetical protein